MQAEATTVHIRNCAKTYPDGTRGLLSTDIDIEAGEVLALLGPSGCGKTTLLRIVAGLETPDLGASVRFGDRDVVSLSVERREIGMVFQHYALFPQMTVAGNIGYGLRIRGVADQDIRQRVGELIDLVRLNGLERKRPAELSGGQRQRVALARAIAVRPKVLLLDEPLTALDAKLKESLRDELAELLRRLRITAIHVTHDQHEAMAIADRLAVMRAGRVVQVGSAEALYREPSHPFVASFLGRVNRLPIHAMPSGDTAAVRIADAWLPLARSDIAAPKSAFIRPEDVGVSAANAPTHHARVSSRTFLGDRGQLLVQDRHGLTLQVDAPRDCALSIGDAVTLTVDVERLMIFGEDE